MRILRAIAGMGIVLVSTSGGVTVAQVSRGGSSSGANTQLMMQLQQAQTERSQLQADNSKLKKDTEELKKQLATAQKQVTTSKAGTEHNQAAVAAARATNETTQKSLDETKARMQELVTRYRETITTLRGIETDRSQLRQQLAAGQSAYDQCAVTNDKLYQVTSEVLDRYQHQGAFSYMQRAEPFTRIKRTQIDNLALEYRQRADELRLKKASGDGAGTSSRSGAPQPTGPAPTSTPATTAPAATAPAPAATPK